MLIKPNRGPNALTRQRRVAGIMKFLGLMFGLGLTGSLLFGDMGLTQYWTMWQHARQLERDIQALQQGNAVLRLEIERAQHDPARIEELAREQLGFVRKGETVYQLADEPQVGSK
ncbi:MAG: septum formation initiator family protein [Nitrospirota bacterium]